MKEKVIVFIVGLLLGAIISTGSIYFYTVANSSNNNQGSRIEMNGGTQPSMPNGERPEIPNNNSQNNSRTNNN
ncbi:MAG: hypothetical protein E7158_03845 [Firmicutes bacterium]|nr:hypothetical protein [Bacillota bacterium]